jgi:hypothetical protein
MPIHAHVRRSLPAALLLTVTLLLVSLSSGAALTDVLTAPAELVSVGEAHSCALEPGGSIACWGDNSQGQTASQPGFYHQVSAGAYHTCGLSTAGAAVCWGMDDSGQAADRPGPFIQISAGSNYTCALTEAGAVECWGNNSFGKAAGKPGPYTYLSAGIDHTCAVKEDGSVECWGKNNFGQANAKAGAYTQVSAGGLHTCALAAGGAVDCWGSNGLGQAGNQAGPYTQVSAGANYTCALSATGIDCWGANTFGEADGQAGAFSQVAAGVYHSCALKTGDGADCWGYNDDAIGQAEDQPGPFGKYVPETTLAAARPPALTNDTGASFQFASPDPAAKFECKLDNAAWTACVSPRAYTDLADGTHTFWVRAVSPPGNVDITPPSHTWTIDTVPPETTLTAKPPALTNSATATFKFTSEPGATFQCSLNDGPWAACNSPRTYTGLVDGQQKFAARASDPAGNVDPSPATFSWLIDATPPEVTITEAPSGTTDQPTATIRFTGEEGAAFRCRLDSLIEFEPCDSPVELTDLEAGQHTFTVWATDEAGNEASASATWIISFEKWTYFPVITR